MVGEGGEAAPGGGRGLQGATRTRRAGDEVAEEFEEFYRLHYVMFVKFVTLLTGSQPDAEDLVQEGFALVAGRYRDLDNPAGYLRTTVVNLVRSRYRAEQRHRDRLRLLRPQLATVDSHETSELLEVVGTLPVRQRVVVVGRYWAGWSEQELARVLGCRPGTIKSLASRALATLRHHIEEAER